MSNRQKMLKWLAYATGVILFLLLGLVFFGPKLINTEWIKENLRQDLSRKISGTVTFRALDLSLFPVPRLIIEGAVLTLPQKMEATIASLQIYPRIKPLFSGNIRLSRVQIQDPALTIYISERKEPPSLSVEEIRAAIRALVGDSSRLTLTVEKGNLSLRKNGQVSGTFRQIDARMMVDTLKDRLRVTLEPLRVASPRIMLSGLLDIQPASPRLSLKIRGRALALEPLRDLALFAAGEMPIVRSLCDILRDGHVPEVSFSSRADSLGALGATRNIDIEGDLEGGRIHIPESGLDLIDVAGHCLLSKGNLKGSNLAGRYGNLDLKQTSFKLNLNEEDPPVQVESLFKADLGEVLTLLPRLVKEKTFLEELKRFQSLSGTARGKLVLGGSLGSLTTQVMVSDLNCSGQHGRIPFPFTINQGEITYDEKQISLKDLKGAVGQTTFSGLTARLDRSKTPHLTLLFGKMHLQTAEIYNWLSSFEKLRSSLKDITTISGTVALSALALEGPVFVPQKWRFKTTGTAENLVIGTPSLPDRLTLRQGAFTLVPGQILLDRLQAAMLDMSATVSGSLRVSSQGPQAVDISLEAETGPRGFQWMKTSANLSTVLKDQQRLSLAQGRLVTSEKGGLSFQGTLRTMSGQTLGLDLKRDKKALKITKLNIEDAVSRLSVALGFSEKTFDLAFSGRLNSSTLAALMEFEQVPTGHLAGDFTAHILKDRPAESTVRGSLSGEKMVLPWKTGIPLYLETLSANAEGSVIQVLSSRLRLADLDLFPKGVLSFGKDGLEVNLEVDADRIAWDSLKKIMAEGKPTEPTTGKGPALGMSVGGKAKISIREFVYDRFSISPLQADLSFSPIRAAAEIRKASLCGLSVQGHLDLTGQEQVMDIKVAAGDADLGPTMTCLSDKEAEITGRFSLDGRFSLSAKNTPPIKGLAGTLSFQAHDGRIAKSIALAKIFSLLSVSEYFRGLPDLRKDSFSYSTITMGSDIRQGRLLLKESILDSPTMTILAEGTVDLTDRKTDITLLASPHNTLDTTLGLIPGKKEDRRVPLISLGARMTGDIKNPEVSAQPLSGISRGLSSNMERILKAPVRIIEHLIP
jgi:hypothetical protein